MVVNCSSVIRSNRFVLKCDSGCNRFVFMWARFIFSGSRPKMFRDFSETALKIL
ncbi:hypothetical protein HanIR_Chr15g0761771 [Helianthus annuus]|nr:hypothetical protein HanIR_Chr15g0761771 [Helianthus annuus]